MTNPLDSRPLMLKCLEFSFFITEKISAANIAGPDADGVHDLDLTLMCEWWAAHFTSPLTEDFAEQLAKSLALTMGEHHSIEQIDCITWEFAHTIHHCYLVVREGRPTEH